MDQRFGRETVQIKRVTRIAGPLIADGAVEPGQTSITWRIERDGEPREYDAMEDVEGLPERFAEWKTRDELDALKFVARYGYLDKRDDVESILKAIRDVQFLVRARDRQRDLPSDERDWSLFTAYMGENSSKIRLHQRFKAHPRPELFFGPDTLLNAALIQLFDGLEATSTSPLRRCKAGCGEWYKIGPNEKHRETAYFCSETCRKAHTYRERRDRELKGAAR